MVASSLPGAVNSLTLGKLQRKGLCDGAENEVTNDTTDTGCAKLQ